MKRITTAIFLLSILTLSARSQDIQPSATYLYAVKDSTELFLDIYEPAPGSETSIDGISKPTLLYLFGGGFMGGARNETKRKPWFGKLSGDGYRVVAMDYRLGLKGTTIKLGVKAVKLFYRAIHLAVEDIYSATSFLIDNSPELGIDTDNIVLCGSSAGAIAALQSEWELCNGRQESGILPEGFNWAGLMAFAGAVFSKEGGVRYDTEPCPTLFMYGTRDKVVPPGRIWFFNVSFEGSDRLYRRFSSRDYNRSIYRYLGNGHEIAGSLTDNYDEQIRFLETNVMKGLKRVTDAKVNAPEIAQPDWGSKSTSELFKEKREGNLAEKR